MTVPDEAGKVAAALRRAFDNTAPLARVERTTAHRDGRPIVLETSAVPIFDAGGELTGLRGIDRDITERKEAAMQLEAAMEAAQAANRTKSLFLANMSHEIRTPMTAVLGFTESLLESDLAEEERHQAIQIIRRNCHHLIDLVNDILDVSKIEAGMMRVERIACSPLEILADVQSLMDTSAREKLVRFEVECATPLPQTIHTDPTRLRQILINVAGNAVKFTDVGCVRLVVQLCDAETGPSLQIDVTDTGVGMTEAQVGKLFQPFTQADISMTRRFGGTGLGLAISRKLAQMLGGDVALAHSAPGEGTHFRITIATGSLDGVAFDDERALDGRVEVVDDDAASEAAPLDCRVLVAEDGRDNQILVRHILQKAGASVEIVENGRDAVDAALAARSAGDAFDVILMDMQMPIMDGYDATASLREQGYDGTIIALTANAMEGAADQCRNAGCDDYASKPIDRKGLVEKLRASVAAAAT